MDRRFSTFIGIDLGGARGKTTAVARLVADRADRHRALIEVVGTRHGGEPWCDEVLVEYLATLEGDAAVAIDAPLTVPACIRCQLPVCPGQQACVDPAVVWLNTLGAELVAADSLAESNRVAATPTTTVAAPSHMDAPRNRSLLAPYIHRCCDVLLQRGRQVAVLGQSSGPLTARAVHLRRALAGRGFELNRNLIEVAPRATVQALFGARMARGYKRDADPWETRAAILEALGDSLRFAPTSRFCREEVLRNDHCFEAVLSAYTAFLWARDGWQLPAEHAAVFGADGWIWVPAEA